MCHSGAPAQVWGLLSRARQCRGVCGGRGRVGMVSRLSDGVGGVVLCTASLRGSRSLGSSDQHSDRQWGGP